MTTARNESDDFQSTSLILQTFENDKVEIGKSKPLTEADLPYGCKPKKRFIPKNSLKKIASQELIKEPDNKSCHETYQAEKEGKTFYCKKMPPKPSNPNSVWMPLLESVCWFWFRMSAESVVPHKTYPVYEIHDNNDIHFVEVASQDLPGFVPNSVNPFKDKDLVINALDIDAGINRFEAYAAIRKAATSSCLQRDTTSWFGYGKEFIFNHTKSVITGDPSASYVKSYLEYFHRKIDQGIELSIAELLDIQQLLLNREKKIKAGKTSAKPGEYELLQETNAAMAKYCNHLQQITHRPNHINIEKLELFDRLIQNEKLDLEEEAEADGKKIKKYADDKILSRSINGEDFSMSVRDLKNYRLTKTQAADNVTSCTSCENDYHNNNHGQKRNEKGYDEKAHFDFDMNEWAFLSNFKEANFVDTWKNFITNWLSYIFPPSNDPYAFEVDDMENFPNIKTPFRYWITQAHLLPTSKTANRTIPFIKNFYVPEDIETAKKLSSHPVYQFHAYKQFLKNILISQAMYQAGAQMFIPTEIVYVDPKNGQHKNLLTEFVHYKTKRMQQLREVLQKTPNFRKFLLEHGKFAFKLIQEEFEADLQKFQQHVKEYKDTDLKAYEAYQRLAKAYEARSHSLATDYQAIFDATTAIKTSEVSKEPLPKVASMK